MPYLSPTLPGSNDIVPPSGTGASRILFMGEAAGDHERRQHRPFVEIAPAGSVLQRAFTRLGMARNDQTITNTVWWQPPNNYLDGAPWQGEAQATCRVWNQDLIQRTQPVVIVALGKLAYHELTGLHEIDITQGRGFITRSKPEYGSIPIVATYHPSYLIRGSKRKNLDTGAMTEKKSGGGWGFFSILLRDINLARSMATNGCPNLGDQLCKSPNVNLYGHTPDWEQVYQAALADPSLPISYDFETPLSVAATDETEFERALGNITQFQVSLRPGHALVSSWDASLLPVIRRLMELPNPKLDWNGRGFDRGILRDLQIRQVGTYIDLMWMWHHAERDWPMGLQFATSFVSPEAGPWKHTFHTDLRSYGARDVHEPQKIYAYLTAVLSGRACVNGKDLLEGYRRQVLLYQNQVFAPLQVRGIPVDNARREILNTVLTGVEESVTAELQSMVPESIKPIKGKGYKGLPPEWLAIAKATATEFIARSIEFEMVSPDVIIQPNAKGKFTKKIIADAEKKHLQWLINKVDFDRWVGPSGSIYVKRQLDGPTSPYVWAELLDFNPNSRDQLLDYIEDQRSREISTIIESAPARYTHSESLARAEEKARYRIPLTFKDQKPTTGKKELDRLIAKTDDPVLSKVIEAKEMNKLVGTYIGGYKDGKPTGWAPHPDGRVHPYYYDGPATGQAAASDPNSLNLVKHLTRIVSVPDLQGNLHQMTLGSSVRTMVCARPSHRLVAADYKSFHVLTTGYNANDPLYMRLAKLDFHSFFAATQLLKLAQPQDLISLSDADLLGQLGEYKADKTPRYAVSGFADKQPFKFVRDKMAKPTGLGYGFCMQAARLCHENQEFIKSIAIAQTLIDGLDQLFPITHHWKRNIPHFAERQGGYLISKHGYIRKFNCLVDRYPVSEDFIPNVRRGESLVRGKDGQLWCQSPGDDNEACVAFLPANDAFGMTREAHLRMAGYESWHDTVPVHEDLLDRYGFIIPLHDENVFEVEASLADELMEKLKYEMEKPSEILLLPDGTGLSCEAEFSISPIGGSWNEMETIH